MANTEKRIDGNYKLTTDTGSSGNVEFDTHTLTVTGNLVVTGSTTTVSSTNTAITDNVIVLNSGESTAGVSSGTAGIEIDRGTSDNATLTYNETDDSFEAKIGASYSKIRGATPVGTNDLATKDYVDTQVSGGGAVVDKINEGNSKAEIFDDGVGTSKFFVNIDGSDVLEATATNLTYGNVQLSGNSITNTATDENLVLATTGTGEIELQDVTKLTDQASDPTGVSGFAKVYAKVPGSGGSGVFVSNINSTDELVTKSKAIVFGLIF